MTMTIYEANDDPHEDDFGYVSYVRPFWQIYSMEAGEKLTASNFNTRLRPLLRALRCEDWYDVVDVPAEVTLHKWMSWCPKCINVYGNHINCNLVTLSDNCHRRKLCS